MEWTDEAIVLGLRRQGETSAILEAMTHARGRHLGLVRGARSPRLAAVLQTGNGVRLTWRARLDEQLGHFAVEPLKQRAATLMASAPGLYAAQTLTAHLPERDPHPELHDALDAILDHVGELLATAELVVRFELMLLDALGFGLDLTRCALTGATEGLAWVSPKTGRAASRAAGAAFAGRLLPLPAFLAPDPGSNRPPPSGADLGEGLALTAHFLSRHLWEPRGIAPPASRESLLAAVRGRQPAME
jgi:DNA repair protein RecO (recombination protein O)